jgi:hypothetical protein
MVVSVGAVIVALALIHPALWAFAFTRSPALRIRRCFIVTELARPTCYLFGVWSIGQALGEIEGAADTGRLALGPAPGRIWRWASAASLSVFVVSNLMRLVGYAKGGYLNFDVPGMTLGMIGGALFLLGRVMDQALAAQAELDEMI